MAETTLRETGAFVVRRPARGRSANARTGGTAEAPPCAAAPTGLSPPGVMMIRGHRISRTAREAELRTLAAEDPQVTAPWPR